MAQRMSLLLATWVLGNTASAEPSATCPAPQDMVLRATDALVAGRIEEARQALDLVEQGWACGARADPMVVVRYWLADGVALSMQGDAEAALSFRAAGRLDPQLWEPRYGDAMRARYEAALRTAVAPSASVRARYEPLEPSAKLLVDGRSIPVGGEIEVGLHVFQIERSDASIELMRILQVEVGEEVVLHRGLLDPASTVASAEVRDAADTPESRWRPRWGVIATGGGSVLVGCGLLELASRQDLQMQAAADTFDASDRGAAAADRALADLDAAFNRQRLLAGLGYGLTGLGAAGIGIGLVW